MAELRRDPILGRWVIIATERSKRPGSYQAEKDVSETPIDQCPFCLGHEAMTPPEIYAIREGGSQPNKPGWKVRVVPNKYPALGIDVSLNKFGVGMFDAMTGFGAHEVIIETPDHRREAKDQSIEEIVLWLRVIQDRVRDLHNDKRFRYILVFKNKGRAAGASLTHPHHQLIATPITVKRVKEELDGAKVYFTQKERCIFCDIIKEETEKGERIVYENDVFIAFCPYAARFPFETWILPKYHCINFYDPKIVDNLRAMADIIKAVLLKFNKALNDPEYNYIIHSAPNMFPRQGYWLTIGDDFHWHIELFPRLVRTAGFEWGSGFYINPTPPEEAAKFMRELKV
jgi:UDPglucose--hexose-1-phosphate uridylyltransferase